MDAGYITVQQLEDDIVPIYAGQGNLHAVPGLLYRLQSSGSCKLSYEELVVIYKKHIRQWNHTYAEKEKKGYLSEDAASKRYNFHDFIQGGYYNYTWGVSSNMVRDEYLFGDNMKRIFEMHNAVVKRLEEVKRDEEYVE